MCIDNGLGPVLHKKTVKESKYLLFKLGHNSSYCAIVDEFIREQRTTYIN